MAILEDGHPGLPEPPGEGQAQARARRLGCLLGLLVLALAGSVVLWKVWLSATSR